MKFAAPGIGESGAPDALNLDHLLADARWQQLVDLLPDGIVLVDKTGFVRYLNSAAESINELLRVEAVGQPLTQLVKRSALDCEMLLDAFSDGAKVNHVIPARNRQSYMVNTRCVRDWNGEVTCFLIIFRDIEQLAKLQAEAHVNPFGGEMDVGPMGDGDEGMVLCEQTSLQVDQALKAAALGSRTIAG